LPRDHQPAFVFLIFPNRQSLSLSI
jgi:hypothetical protein